MRPLEGVDAQQQLDVIDELLEAGVQGIALSPAEDERVRARIQELSERMPVVTFNSDLPDSGRLCYVGVDNFACGRMSAGLMDLLLAGHGEVLLVAGQENNWSHQQRVDGFQAEAAANFPGLSLLPPQTCGDDQQLAHDIVCRAVQEHPSLRGVYVSVNGQLGACDALRELGLQGKVHLICHDLIPANTENVRRGLIDFLIDQDAALQAPVRSSCSWTTCWQAKSRRPTAFLRALISATATTCEVRDERGFAARLRRFDTFSGISRTE